MIDTTTFAFLGAVKDALRFAATPRADHRNSRVRIEWNGADLLVSAHNVLYGSVEDVPAEGEDEAFVFHLSAADAKHLGEVFKLAPGLGETPLYLDHANDKLSVRHLAGGSDVQARQAFYLDALENDDEAPPQPIERIFGNLGAQRVDVAPLAVHPLFLAGLGATAKRRGEVPLLSAYSRAALAQVGSRLSVFAAYCDRDDDEYGAEETQVAMESVGASV